MKCFFLFLIVLTSLSCGSKQDQQSSASGKQHQYNKIDILESSVLNNRIRLSIPVDFKPMEQDEILVKYQRSNSVPQEAYSNDTGTISLAFNHTSNALSLADLPDFRQSFARQFKGTLGIEFKGSSIKNINGRDFAILEFISPAMDTNIYNLMFLTSLDNRLLICTFNCVQGEMEKWKPTSQQILNSVQVIE